MSRLNATDPHPATASPADDEMTGAADAGPSPDELDAIETERPLIEAEIALLDAQITILNAVPGPSELDWRRLRRAQHRVLREAAALASRPAAAAPLGRAA